MLGLKLPTDPRWANIAEGNLEEILTDHAWCEQKAASNAISLIVTNPDKTEMVDELLLIAQEEMSHFQMVHEKLKERGFKLGPERKDDYVNELSKFIRKGVSRQVSLVDRLLFAAMIEARSCERFRILSEYIKDKELADFYRELMISEANHYKVFINFARLYGNREETDQRWQQFLDYEAQVVSRYGQRETIHG
jgi:tRNA 2-(methylsulfanyl)-N6-isopentenyladenosine37 hydroxylase